MPLEDNMDLSQIKKIAVIGSGIMGHGIGQTFALGGYDVTLNDITDELLDKALRQIRKNLDTFIEFGITTRMLRRRPFKGSRQRQPLRRRLRMQTWS